ncbi:hypothetical protein ACHQM5_014809 [Ranunculus cassubicifolius]
MAAKKITIKLVVNTARNKILFAECDKDFVDILFSFLTLPIGTIIRLANKNSQLGSMDNLYNSVEDLDTDYLHTVSTKRMLLRPKSVAQNKYRNLAFNPFHSVDDQLAHYLCSSPSCSTDVHGLISMFANAKCLCGKVMDKNVVIVENEGMGEGDKTNGVFVKGIRRFMISDDLKVSEVSEETSFSIFFKFGIKDGTSLEVKTVTVGTQESASVFSEKFNAETRSFIFTRTKFFYQKICKKHEILFKQFNRNW